MNINDAREWAHEGSRDILRYGFGRSVLFPMKNIFGGIRDEAHTGRNRMQEIMEKIEVYNSLSSGGQDYY